MTTTTFSAPEVDVSAAPPTGHAAVVNQLVQHVIRTAAANTPRSRQRSIGPSEIGDPCPRRLAYRILDWPQANTGSDPWPATVGTAGHAWLADTFAQLGDGWHVEQHLNISGQIGGSCDLYHEPSGTVIDWKLVGTSTMREYRRNGPSARYRTQVHLYGLGWTNAGKPVNHVAIVFLPRSGYLSGLHVWSESYDKTVADAALQRLADITLAAAQLDIDSHPERFALIPANPSHACTFCPWLSPGSSDAARGCTGNFPPTPATATANAI